jgi:hypothetical protein
VNEHRTIPKEEITVLLASALGQEKSDEVVVTAARELGLAGAHYGPDEVRAIFAKLVAADGLVGVVARFAVTRGDVERLASKARPPSERQLPASSPAPVVDLLALLAPALGAEKARDATEAAAAKIGADVQALTRDDALRVLDVLASTEGIVGVVARFAKARFLLSSGPT